MFKFANFFSCFSSSCKVAQINEAVWQEAAATIPDYNPNALNDMDSSQKIAIETTFLTATPNTLPTLECTNQIAVESDFSYFEDKNSQLQVVLRKLQDLILISYALTERKSKDINTNLFKNSHPFTLLAEEMSQLETIDDQLSIFKEQLKVRVLQLDNSLHILQVWCQLIMQIIKRISAITVEKKYDRPQPFSPKLDVLPEVPTLKS